MSPEMLTVLTTLGLYAAVVVSPGPNFALISRLSMSGARTAAIGATFGLAIVAAFYAFMTMMGLALVLTRIGWLASLIQIAGGCYLIYLGLTAWLSHRPAIAAQGTGIAPTSTWRGFRTGLIVNLSNPKGIAFFVGLYAVAIPLDTVLWAKLAILAGGFVLEIVWYGFLIILLSSRPARAVYARFGLWIERVIGTFLAAFGLRLISEKL